MTRALARQLLRLPSFERLSETSIDIENLLARLNMNAEERLTRNHLRNVIRLSQLTDETITEYLSKFQEELMQATKITIHEAKAFLYRIYDLADLMRRPLLLSMVVATILAGGVNIQDRSLILGPSTLYDLYTQLCVKRDLQKGEKSQFLSEEERLQACRQIALQMLDTGSIELRNSEVYEAVEKARLTRVVEKRKSSLRLSALESAVTDIRVCSFLSHGKDGTLRFAHKSYFEFFVAQALVVACQNTIETLIPFSKRHLGKEILYFLGSFARDLDSFGRMITAVLKRAPQNAEGLMNLCARIAFASGTSLERLGLCGVTVDNVELHRANVAHVSFDNVRFINASMHEVPTKCVRCVSPFENQYRRANFRHASTASVPLLQKNVRCNPDNAASRAASCPCSGW